MGGVLQICYEMAISLSVVDDKTNKVERNMVLESGEDARRTDSNAEKLAVATKPTEHQIPKAQSPGIPKRRTPPRSGKKYVSQMAQAREEKKRREASSGKSKDWPGSSDADTSSTPSSADSGSLTSDVPNGVQREGAAAVAKNGGSTASKLEAEKAVGGPGHLPKFGEWDNHTVDSGPCYTLLFQNAAEQKKNGGPVLVHAQKPSSKPGVTEDLYDFNYGGMKSKKKKQFILLCCFSSA